MKWSECKLICLQTMFANEGTTLNADDTNQDYIDAMPGKANEGLHQLALVGRPILKSYDIELVNQMPEPPAPEKPAEGPAPETEPAPPEKLVLPVGGLHIIPLTDYIPRFRAMDRIVMATAGGYGPLTDWDLEGDNVLVLPARAPGTVKLWYRAYPQTITTATPDDEELDVAPECASLLPLFMAAELYKEDDLSMATVWRNQFEDGLAKVRDAYAKSGGGARMLPKRNTTGWW